MMTDTEINREAGAAVSRRRSTLPPAVLEGPQVLPLASEDMPIDLRDGSDAQWGLWLFCYARAWGFQEAFDALRTVLGLAVPAA